MANLGESICLSTSLEEGNSVYHWEPIHDAAFEVDYVKLSKIITALPDYNDAVKNKILNALSIFSENALHILLAYGKGVESFQVHLTNGWENRICQVITEADDKVWKCAELLIKAGIDINHCNIWNESPIILAIRHRQLKVIKLLLMEGSIDVDSCKNSLTGKCVRDLLTEHNIFLDLIPGYMEFGDEYQMLFTYIKGSYVEEFLRFNNGLIGEYINELDQYNQTGGTILQVCLVKSLSDYKLERSTYEMHTDDSNIMKTRMLKWFCLQDYGKYVEHLLSNRADIHRKTSFFRGKNVIQMSVDLNYYPFLALLLGNKNSDISWEHIINALNQVHSLNKVYSKHVLCLLVWKLEALMALMPLWAPYETLIKDTLNRVLDLYLAYSENNEYARDICHVLNLGASLVVLKENEDQNENEKRTQKKKNEEKEASKAKKEFVRLSKIHYNTLKNHLDECVKGNEIHYDSLITTDSETVVVDFLVRDGKKRDLLSHPVLIRLIHEKWLKTNKFFYTNLVFYVFFLLSLYWRVIDAQTTTFNRTSLAVFITTLCIQTVKVAAQLFLNGRRYLYDFSNYLEIIMIFCCFVNVVLDKFRFDFEHYYFTAYTVATVMAVLISTLDFILMLGQVPKFTKYMVIFSSTKYFLEYVLFYSIQFFSFAICFSMLLRPEQPVTNNTTFADSLSNIIQTLFDTLLFFIGQYDGDITNPPRFPRFGRIVVATFIFCMTIILNNLLVGLIVTDMDLIQKTSKLEREVKIVEYVVKLEQFLASLKKLCGCKHFIDCKFDTKVFKLGKAKTLETWNGSAGLDGEDKKYLKALKDTKAPNNNVLYELYGYIVQEVNANHKTA